MIRKTLAGDVVPRDALAEKDKVKKRERDFTVPTEISFNNEGSEIYTMIEVDTRDRPGLIYDLSRTLANNHIFHRQRHHRHLWRAGGGHLLCQGCVRAEDPLQGPSRTPSPASCARRSSRGRKGRWRGHGPIRLVAAFFTVGIWTFASRILGFVRDILIAGFLGAGPGGRGLPDRLRAPQHVPPLLRRRRVQHGLRADVLETAGAGRGCGSLRQQRGGGAGADPDRADHPGDDLHALAGAGHGLRFSPRTSV